MKPQSFNYFNIVLMSLIESLFKCSFNAVELSPFSLCLNLKMVLWTFLGASLQILYWDHLLSIKKSSRSIGILFGWTTTGLSSYFASVDTPSTVQMVVTNGGGMHQNYFHTQQLHQQWNSNGLFWCYGAHTEKYVNVASSRLFIDFWFFTKSIMTCTCVDDGLRFLLQ